MADFTGFYFDGIHSSTYHLIRTSDGDRYHDILFPDFEDSTIELVGGEGEYFEKTNIKKKEFSVDIAFDSVTEQDFRKIREWLSPGEIKEFRFDERPYKAYWAKLSKAPEFEYICFLEEEYIGHPQRVYKGEASLDFVVYNPYGYCIDNTTRMTENGLVAQNGNNWQSLDSYLSLKSKTDNLTEWGTTSGLLRDEDLEEKNQFVGRHTIEGKFNYEAELYNPGDFDVDFELFIDFCSDAQSNGGLNSIMTDFGNTEIEIQSNGKSEYFVFSVADFKFRDKIILDTKKHALIRYASSALLNNYPSGQETFFKEMRYDKVRSTHWLKIPKGNSKIIVKSIPGEATVQIKYNYKYY